MARKRPGWPSEPAGRTALRSTAIAFLLALVLLALTPWAATTWGIDAAWVFPQISCAAIILAALINLGSYLFAGQRSVANLVSLSLTATFGFYCVLFIWISQAAGS